MGNAQIPRDAPSVIAKGWHGTNGIMSEQVTKAIVERVEGIEGGGAAVEKARLLLKQATMMNDEAIS